MFKRFKIFSHGKEHNKVFNVGRGVIKTKKKCGNHCPEYYLLNFSKNINLMLEEGEPLAGRGERNKCCIFFEDLKKIFN